MMFKGKKCLTHQEFKSFFYNLKEKAKKDFVRELDELDNLKNKEEVYV
ncbi:MAG: hypothetical protein LBC61_01535 [Candidatus Peribacteria bacterium]|nr:hypothetical protein [Candidatus Peribacteria bacterium]